MRVFLAGATGAIGRRLVPRLAAAGHQVHGMTRSESKRKLLAELGAAPVVADTLDHDQVAEAVAAARPEVIVHQLTAIGSVSLRRFDRSFAPRLAPGEEQFELVRKRKFPLVGDGGGIWSFIHVADAAEAPAHPSWRQGFAAA